MEEQRQQQTAGQPKPEGLLYHYTNQKGLHGIIEQKCIWATHSQYLNDTSEFQITFDALRETIHQDLKCEKNENWANFFSGFLSYRQKESSSLLSLKGAKEILSQCGGLIHRILANTR